MREKQILCLIFDYLDSLSSQPISRQCEVDVVLNELKNIYKVDLVDMTNCFLDYAWAFEDGKNPIEVVDKFYSQHCFI